MPEYLLNSLPGAVIALVSILLSAVAYRRMNTKQLGEIQERVIATYKAQDDAQQKQIERLEKKIVHLERILATLQTTLKKRRGLLIEIQDEVITLVDQRTGAEHTVQIHASGPLEDKDKETENK